MCFVASRINNIVETPGHETPGQVPVSQKKELSCRLKCLWLNFFVSFYILIWLIKTILLYLSAERGFKKLKETRVLDLIKANFNVKC